MQRLVALAIALGGTAQAQVPTLQSASVLEVIDETRAEARLIAGTDGDVLLLLHNHEDERAPDKVLRISGGRIAGPALLVPRVLQSATGTIGLFSPAANRLIVVDASLEHVTELSADGRVLQRHALPESSSWQHLGDIMVAAQLATGQTLFHTGVTAGPTEQWLVAIAPDGTVAWQHRLGAVTSKLLDAVPRGDGGVDALWYQDTDPESDTDTPRHEHRWLGTFDREGKLVRRVELSPRPGACGLVTGGAMCWAFPEGGGAEIELFDAAGESRHRSSLPFVLGDHWPIGVSELLHGPFLRLGDGLARRVETDETTFHLVVIDGSGAASWRTRDFVDVQAFDAVVTSRQEIVTVTREKSRPAVLRIERTAAP